MSGMGAFYFAGVAAIAGILVYEHVLVRDARHDGTSKNLGVAFFNANAYVSVAFFAFALADVVLR
jgi:4-hydroxybenzoate polyprenyltransferase